MHLVDHARTLYRADLPPARGTSALLRAVLGAVLPTPERCSALSLLGARLARPFAGLIPGRVCWRSGCAPCWHLAPRRCLPQADASAPQVHRAEGDRRARVALLTGCAQQVLAPEINEATIRLLTRLGVEVVVARALAAAAR